jgi:hypothetical protein
MIERKEKGGIKRGGWSKVKVEEEKRKKET